MEYATEIMSPVCDDNYIKHVGYSQHICDDACGESCIQKFFSQKNINKISCKITELLQGVDKNNRPIIVPDKTICSVMNSVNNNFRPETGDIYSRYTISPITKNQNLIQQMMDQVINIIVTDVKVNLGMEECNSKLTIWTTILGDFNNHGLRSHPPIKIREKRTQPMMFNMNY
jgi:hypothetical protein